MSDKIASMDIALATSQLNTLCLKVGLRLAEALPATKSGLAPPASAALWSSSYAHLLLWPLQSIEPVAIERGASEAEGWLDEVLSSLEAGHSGRPIDGYLVLALPRPPQDDAKDDIRRLELSARLCRKHLIWPAEATNSEPPSEPWCRVADITVLGLPDAVTAAVDEHQWPTLDREAEAVWADLESFGVPATAQKDEAT
ncbi:MAG: hypothetical protein CVV14_14415 [Gammaproteobacteria bacterium HGW-Gammaproteobacteria-4]|nr:MAG: hypothetical protein CVV14_14415 [Gammaproteobacteria bacterium HGW-Gammaproteobacteria-4]PKQ36493.1 MAG: hypothetical protein CVT59_12020 [Actinobacteria bacterium HGW-Actinobacteria-1]